MAVEYPEITESNRAVLDHILIDLHDALKMLTEQGKLQAKHDALLEEFRPLLEQFRNPTVMTMLGTRRARRNGNG